MIDEIGLKIIKELNKNSRTSFAEIGRRIGLSPSSVRERIQDLEESGIIKGYRLELNHTGLGYDLQVFILLKLFSGKLKPFLSILHSFEEVKEAYRITGSHNIQLKVVLRNQTHLHEFVDKLIEYGEPTTHLILSGLLEK